MWSTDRPTPGKWWVSIHPDMRSRFGLAAVYEALVFQDRVQLRVPNSDERPEEYSLMFMAFRGSLWQPRSTPADPFKE